jgi:hypothetical protein
LRASDASADAFSDTARCFTKSFHPIGLMVKVTPTISCAPVNPSPAPNGMPKLSGTLIAVCCR